MVVQVVVYVIVPGIGGSGGGHWQTLWEQRWGPAATRIAPRSWSRPDLSDWVAAVGLAVDDAAARDDEVVLIAHSLGCWAAAAWSHGSGVTPVRRALLVAPPDQRGSAFPVEAAPAFVGVEARTLPFPSMVVASTDDPYCRPEVAQGIASSWGSALRFVGERGHLNGASRLGDWPEGRELLDGPFDPSAAPSLRRPDQPVPSP